MWRLLEGVLVFTLHLSTNLLLFRATQSLFYFEWAGHNNDFPLCSGAALDWAVYTVQSSVIPAVEVDPLVIDLAVSARQDARPGQGHAKFLYPQQVHRGDVIQVPVVKVVRHRTCARLLIIKSDY